MTTITKTHTAVKIKLAALLICAMGGIFYGYAYLLRIEPAAIVTALMRHFNTNATITSILTSMYYLAYVPMQIAAGLILDHFAPRRTLTAAILTAVLGSILFAATKNIYIAELGRFIIGIGTAFAYVGALKLATIWLPPRHFATFAGIVTASGLLFMSIGNGVFSIVMQKFAWQHLTFMLSGLGIILAILTYLVVRDVNKDDQETHPHQVMTVKETMNGLWLTVRNPQIWLCGLIGLAYFLPIQIFSEFWGNSFLHNVYHCPITTAALGVSLTGIGSALGSLTAGWMVELTRSNKTPIYITCALSALCLLLVIYGTFLPIYVIFFLLFAYSFLSGPHILCFSVARENTPHQNAAIALAFTNMLVMAGGFIFQPLSGKILDLGWQGQIVNGAHVYPPHAYQSAMSILPIVFVFGIVCAYLLRETYTHDVVK